MTWYGYLGRQQAVDQTALRSSNSSVTYRTTQRQSWEEKYFHCGFLLTRERDKKLCLTWKRNSLITAFFSIPVESAGIGHMIIYVPEFIK